MFPALETVALALGLWALTAEPPVELYHVDLERVITSSRAGRAAQGRVAALERRLQAEASAREARIQGLRAAARSETSADATARLRAAIEEHGERLEAAAQALERASAAELEPLVRQVRARVATLESSRRRVLIMEDQPLVAPPERCDLSAALREALDGGRAPAAPSEPECRARHLFLLGFDEAVRASRAGAEAAGRVEALRVQLQAELDGRRSSLEPHRAKGDYEAELELADQFARNQARLRESEATEEARLYATLARAVELAARQRPDARFLDAAAAAPIGLEICDARAWSTEVLDRGADLRRLLELCAIRPRE